MSAPGRWLRLDVGCFESEWLAALSVPAQHAWTRLLLHTKGQGTGGRVKRLGPVAAEKLWSIPPVSLQEMETAAIADGALAIEDGWWVLTGWDKYQQPDRTNALRKQRLRDKRKAGQIPPVSAGNHRSPPGTRHATETVTERTTTSTHARKRGWRFCPDDFEPSDDHRKLAEELHVDLDREFTAFKLWEFKQPKTDASRAFFRWLRTAAERGSANGNGNGKRWSPETSSARQARNPGIIRLPGA